MAGNIEKGDEDVAATYLVQRFAMQPRWLRMAGDGGDDAMDDDDDTNNGEMVELVGEGRVGELGTIISVIKIASELGEAVLPVVIKEVQASPIGNLVIGVIGGINDGASGASGPVPIKVVRRAVKGFLRSYSQSN